MKMKSKFPYIAVQCDLMKSDTAYMLEQYNLAEQLDAPRDAYAINPGDKKVHLVREMSQASRESFEALAKLTLAELDIQPETKHLLTVVSGISGEDFWRVDHLTVDEMRKDVISTAILTESFEELSRNDDETLEAYLFDNEVEIIAIFVGHINAVQPLDVAGEKA